MGTSGRRESATRELRHEQHCYHNQLRMFLVFTSCVFSAKGRINEPKHWKSVRCSHLEDGAVSVKS